MLFYLSQTEIMNYFLTVLFVATCSTVFSQDLYLEDPDKIMPVRGFCIAAPQPEDLEEFIRFIDEELGPRKVNTLILRIDYN